MTADLSLLSGFARGVLLSLHVRDTCLHSGSRLLSGCWMVKRSMELQAFDILQGSKNLNPKPCSGILIASVGGNLRALPHQNCIYGLTKQHESGFSDPASDE